MPRIRIWTAPERVTGEIVAEELRAAGLPIVGMQSGTELYPSSTLYDLFLEDESLLEDPTVQQTIKDAIDGRALTAEEEDAAAAMPYEEPEPPKPLKKGKPDRLLMTLIAVILMGIALWVAIGYMQKAFGGEL